MKKIGAGEPFAPRQAPSTSLPSATLRASGASSGQAQGEPFGLPPRRASGQAQGEPFGLPQGEPFGLAQGEPFGLPQGERGGVLQVILIILGVILLLAVVSVLAALWAVNRYAKVEVDQSGERKRVQVRTPIGEFEIEKAEDAAQKLKLPIYPGAEPEDDSVSLRLWGRIEKEEGGFTVTAAKFRSRDALEKVDAWYQEKLGPGFKREEGRIVGGDRRGSDRDWEIRIEPGGDDVLYKQEIPGNIRGVVLSRHPGEIKISMFEVGESRPQ